MASTHKPSSRAPADRRILVPVDFSEYAAAALAEADAIVRDGQGTLTLLHVLKIVELGVVKIKHIKDRERAGKEIRAAEQKLVDFSGGLATPAERVSHEVVLGDPKVELVKLSDSYDLIVIAAHGLSGLRRLVLGSVAEKVVRNANCSVLLVRPVAS